MNTSHVRSTSLPCSPHPLVMSVEEQLRKLKGWQTQPSYVQLVGLRTLCASVHEFLQFPRVGNELSKNRVENDHHEEMILNGSTRLLDMCSSTRDFLSQMREYTQKMESCLRRKRVGEASYTREIMSPWKKLNKVTIKCTRGIKRAEHNKAPTFLDQKEHKLTFLAYTLCEIERVSRSIFNSVLDSFIHVHPTLTQQGRASRWPLVSQTMLPSRQRASYGATINAAELLLFGSSKKINHEEVKVILKGLEALEFTIKEEEEELECVYRQFMKIRVSLLNFVSG